MTGQFVQLEANDESSVSSLYYQSIWRGYKRSMIKKDKSHQMRELEYWEKLAADIKNNLKCARVLPDDTPEFILKLLTEFEIEVTKFCFDGYSGLMLDAGCGNGAILMHALELFPESNINYVGLDFSRNILKKAVARAKEKSNASFFQGSITNLPFEDNTFDRVVSSGVITYLGSLDEAEESINEFYRILKPDGILIIDYFNRLSPSGIAMQILHRPLPNPPKNLSPFWFTKKLREAGFSIFTYRGYDFKPLSGYLFMSRWKHLDPGFIQDRFSSFIEKKIVPHIPIISLFGHRIYVKCRK
jgi:SAM-dependent methyltransferase